MIATLKTRCRGARPAIRALLAVLLVLGLAPWPARAQDDPARLSLPKTATHRGERLELPITLNNLEGRQVAAAEIRVRFSASALVLEEIVSAGTLSEGWLVKHTTRALGNSREVHLVLAGLESAATDGALLALAFRVPPSVPFGAFSTLELVSAVLEQPPAGAPLPLLLRHGSLRVGVPPTLWTNAGLALDEGGSGIVDAGVLEVRDPDNRPEELVYTLREIPAQGTLSDPLGPLAQGDTFTQAEVNQGALRYAHDGGESTADAFAFAATDGAGAALSGRFAIRINPVNDPPELAPVGDLQVDEGQVAAIDLEASDPDGTPRLSATGLPPFARLEDRGDGRAILSLAPDFARAGTYPGIELVATDEADPALTDRETITLVVIDINRPPLAAAGADIERPYTALEATSVALDGSGSSDPDGDALSYRWLENGALVATGPSPTVHLPLGLHTLSLVVSDGALDSAPDQVQVHIVDGTPPVLSLLGPDPLYVELGTPYADPGASALDEVDGDLSAAVSVSGAVNERAEGEYAVNYQVRDAAGNAAPPLRRAVRVVVTPNSYSLIATNSMGIGARATVHDGFVGVVDHGQRPFVGSRAELVVGTRAAIEGLRVSAPRVQLRNRASIAGTLVYTEQVFSSRNVEIGREQPVGPEHWPLFADFGVPAFKSGAPGNRNIDVRNNRTLTLFPFNSDYGDIRVRSRGTLVLVGGEYRFANLRLDQGAALVAQGPITLLVQGELRLGEEAYFGPQDQSLDPADILVYVHGPEDRRRDQDDDDDEDEEEDDAARRVVRIGEEARFLGNLYAPRGTISLDENSQSMGSFIGRNLVVGNNAEVSLRSGWKTPDVQYEPPPWSPASGLAARKAGAVLPEADAGLASYPNPFNPATTLYYALPSFAPVQLTIYSALGQKVRVLVDRAQPPGAHTVEWDGRNARGRAVASGVYLAHLRAGDLRRVHKLVLTR